MTADHQPSPNALEAGECVSYRLRRAARIAARFYDKALKPCGLRTTQFTLLGALDYYGEISIGELSKQLAIDGTTLTRNLEVLVRRGEIENVEDEDARVRKVHLTAQGKETFANAMPHWREAQIQVTEALASDRWVDLRASMLEIETTCAVPD